MKKALFGILTAATLSNAWADPMVCAPCPGGVTEVAIGVISSDIRSQMPDAAATYISSRRPSGLRDGGTYVVTSPQDFRNVFSAAAGRCQRIKQLTVVSHGSNGKVYFNHDSLGVHNLDQLLDGAACAMARNAIIDMSGCNTGRGCRGEDFQQRLAGQLLRNGGGQVIANTQYSSTFLPGVIPHFSLNLDRQILTVGPTGNAMHWDNTPQTAGQCVERAREAITRLDAIQGRHGCLMSSSQSSALVRARQTLATYITQESQPGYSRIGIDAAHRDAQNNLLNGFWEYEWVQRQVETIGVCSNGSPVIEPDYDVDLVRGPGGGSRPHAYRAE